jgi:WD40 repeat protein
VTRSTKFDVFISYCHRPDVDTGIAHALQDRLQRFGRPWHNLWRTLRVFLDTTNLPSSPDLRNTIRTALQNSTWLILIATPASAASEWVRQEVEWWVQHKSLDQLILVHAGGVIRWDPAVDRFAGCTDSLPPRLLTEIEREPLWVSLVPPGGTTHSDDGSLELTALLETATARISAGIRGMSLDEVVGAHLHQRRRAQRTMAGATALTTMLAVLAGAAGNAFYDQRNEAREQRDQAVSRQLATQAGALRDTDPALARQFGLAAYETSQTAEARGQLLSSASMPADTRVPDHTGATYSAAAGADGHLLMTAGTDGYASVWDAWAVPAPRLLSRLPVDPNGVLAMALSGDARTLAVGDYDGGITLWDVSDPGHPGQLSTITAAHHRQVGAVSFSPDDAVLASGGEDGLAVLWDITDPHRPAAIGAPLTGHTRGITSVTFAPDGHTLATGSRDRTVRLWRLDDPTHPEPIGRPLAAHTSDVTSLAFAPDGATLATAGLDGTVRLWRIAPSGAATPDGDPLTGHTNAVFTVAFSPDGHRLASGSNDDTVRVWDRRTHAVLATLPHPLSVQTVHFLGSPDELATGGNDGQLRVWHLAGRILSAGQDSLVSAVQSPDGRLVATGSVDNSVQLWDVTDPDHARPVGEPLLGHASAVDRMAFRPDGRLLAVPSDDHTITLWEVSDPSRPRVVGQPLTGHRSPVTSVSFGPDGNLLVSGSVDGSVVVWDVTDPAHPTATAKLEDRQGGITDVAISPDGRTLAVPGGDRTTWLYDITDPQHPSRLGDPLAGHTQTVLAARFSGDGHVLATAGEDGLVWLWDVGDRQHPVAVKSALHNTGGATIDVALGPDGQLAAANSDGSIWLWDVRPDRAALRARLVGHRGAVYSVRFAPDGRHLLSGGADGTAVIWDTSPDDVRLAICTGVGAPPTEGEWAANAPGVVPTPMC